MLTIITNEMEFIHPDNCIEWVQDGILFTVNGEWRKVEHKDVFRIFTTEEEEV